MGSIVGTKTSVQAHWQKNARKLRTIFRTKWCVFFNVQENNALVSGNPRTPIPGECGALAGDFSGFGLSLFPRYVGFSTALGASIGERGP